MKYGIYARSLSIWMVIKIKSKKDSGWYGLNDSIVQFSLFLEAWLC